MHIYMHIHTCVCVCVHIYSSCFCGITCARSQLSGIVRKYTYIHACVCVFVRGRVCAITKFLDIFVLGNLVIVCARARVCVCVCVCVCARVRLSHLLCDDFLVVSYLVVGR